MRIAASGNAMKNRRRVPATRARGIAPQSNVRHESADRCAAWRAPSIAVARIAVRGGSAPAHRRLPPRTDAATMCRNPRRPPAGGRASAGGAGCQHPDCRSPSLHSLLPETEPFHASLLLGADCDFSDVDRRRLGGGSGLCRPIRRWSPDNSKTVCGISCDSTRIHQAGPRSGCTSTLDRSTRRSRNADWPITWNIWRSMDRRIFRRDRSCRSSSRWG